MHIRSSQEMELSSGSSVCCRLSFVIIQLIIVATVVVLIFRAHEPSTNIHELSKSLNTRQTNRPTTSPIQRWTKSPTPSPSVTPPTIHSTSPPTSPRIVKNPWSSNDVGRYLRQLEEYNSIESIKHGLSPSLPINNNERIVHTMKNVINKKKIVIGLFGSSVIASHDCCHSDGLGSQLKNTLTEMFPGMEIEIREGGQGGSCGSSHRNRIYAIKKIVGIDIDILVYSYGYFEGREAGFTEHETLIHWLYRFFPNKPPLFVLNTGGWSDKECYNEHNAKLINHYQPQSFKYICLKRAIAVDPRRNISSVGWHQIDQIHPHIRPLAKSTDKLRKRISGEFFSNWHPNARGHEIFSDMIAYIIGTAYGLVNVIQPSPSIPSPLYVHKSVTNREYLPECWSIENMQFGHGIKSSNNFGWSMNRSPEGRINKVPRDLRNNNDCKHVDQCGWIRPNSLTHNLIQFKLPATDIGKLFICGPDKKAGDQLQKARSSMDISIDGRQVTNSPPTGPESNCITLQDKMIADNSEGNPILSINSKVYVSISYICWL